ncbi:unnamed protein product, partial [Hapterophycus canaliculatus]
EFFWELGAHSRLQRGNWLALRQGPWKYVSTPKDGQWLFNIESDANETDNLAEQEVARLDLMKQRALELSSEYRQSGQHASE